MERCYGCLQLKELSENEFICTAKEKKLTKEQVEEKKDCIDRMDELNRASKSNITHEIIAKHGTFDKQGDWIGEENTVSWNGNPPKIDIRYWKADRSKSRKLGTVTDDAARKLKDILKNIYE